MKVNTEEAVHAGLRYLAWYEKKGKEHGNMIDYEVTKRHLNKIYCMDAKGLVKCRDIEH